MSTSYWIKEMDHQYDRDNLEEAVQSVGGRLQDYSEPPSNVAARLDDDFVHLYFVKGLLASFDVYGRNDPEWFIELLELGGLSVISEHDDEFEAFLRNS